MGKFKTVPSIGEIKPNRSQTKYSKSQVAKVGKKLKGQIDLERYSWEEINKIFRVSYDWIDSHATPMKKIRSEMIGRVSSLRLNGITVARLKRMQSVRKKLRAISVKLDQIQDLGGCRIILPSMAEVNRLVSSLQDKSRHPIFGENDYIALPKPSGYRCHHLIFQYDAKDDTAIFNGRRIEVQVRTRLQHSWATAVESVGLLLQEDMKAGKGNQEWLRLFELMSTELALAEGKIPDPDYQARNKRIQEIRSLNTSLGAISLLEDFRQVVRQLDRIPRGKNKPSYYQLEYNHDKKTVCVQPKFSTPATLNSYQSSPRKEDISGIESLNRVLVEADKVEDLKEAYPNYFGDVRIFCSNLQRIVNGQEAIEFTMPPVNLYPRKREVLGDLSWLRPGRNRRWK
ncbi:MAG: RelA/SpoT domain-containing protein [Rhodospirillales bacterium]|nr:RelA/SpoT domain-containing protein [Rhodospirillales bacterium]